MLFHHALYKKRARQQKPIGVGYNIASSTVKSSDCCNLNSTTTLGVFPFQSIPLFRAGVARPSFGGAELLQRFDPTPATWTTVDSGGTFTTIFDCKDVYLDDSIICESTNENWADVPAGDGLTMKMVGL